jgi:hypothetical protein
MRTLIEDLGSQFANIDRCQRELLDKTPDDKLFWTPVSTADTLVLMSVGGAILRSAAMVEQAFLGMTRRLWDDPFEWTLPEKLSTKDSMSEYLNEVVDTRNAGLAFLTSDSDLSKQLPAPDALKSILAVLVAAVASSENYLGRGEAIYRLLSE